MRGALTARVHCRPAPNSFCPYHFWVAENGKPVHVHVAVKTPTKDATKLWLTRSGGCVVAHNAGRISQRDLSDIMEFVSLNHAEICAKWSERFRGSLEFYR